ncbi:MW1434 family type I TA system toxin [Wenyingzhuangia sp. 2_MG-2023]|uniref:Thoeris anti-defense Tad2 family protein n=1 Tax=Wenyingzhuangia sp. 2_MG-2023 TaxID=3062639 RepID=UPI0026E1E6F4|nr:MW1434 family type I TA system toxin [Wenyingzhuangia sp. 2_MG-2023]MDO6737081.1 DUF2829 domain-containing protein [Wenyingzhuangia sp. 2_MG-2023]
MENYIGVKNIKASPMTRGEYNRYRGWDLPKDEDGSEKGYLVEYLDSKKIVHPNHKGYISWSPKDVFDKAYRKTKGLTFGLVLEAIKLGKKAYRSEWIGKVNFIWFLPSPTERKKWVGSSKIIDSFEGEKENSIGSIRITIDKKNSTTWVPTEEDVLAEDWTVLD